MIILCCTLNCASHHTGKVTIRSATDFLDEFYHPDRIRVDKKIAYRFIVILMESEAEMLALRSALYGHVCVCVGVGVGMGMNTHSLFLLLFHTQIRIPECELSPFPGGKSDKPG
jgi:hypothetical protein